MEAASRTEREAATKRFIKRVGKSLKKYYETANDPHAYDGHKSRPVKVPKLMGNVVKIAALLNKQVHTYDCMCAANRTIVFTRASSIKRPYTDIGHPHDLAMKVMKELDDRISATTNERVTKEMKIIQDRFVQGQKEITLEFMPCRATVKRLKDMYWTVTTHESGSIVSIAPVF
jgi:hypothetical protein